MLFAQPTRHDIPDDSPATCEHPTERVARVALNFAQVVRAEGEQVVLAASNDPGGRGNTRRSAEYDVLINTLRGESLDVLDGGTDVTTSALYFGTQQLPVRSAILLDDAHALDPGHAFKLIVDRVPLQVGEVLNGVGHHVLCGERLGRDGDIGEINLSHRYLRWLQRRAGMLDRLRVCWGVNGTAKNTITSLADTLTGHHRVIEIPGDPRSFSSLNFLSSFVRESQAHLGVMFDHNTNAVSILDNTGKVMPEITNRHVFGAMKRDDDVEAKLLPTKNQGTRTPFQYTDALKTVLDFLQGVSWLATGAERDFISSRNFASP